MRQPASEGARIADAIQLLESAGYVVIDIGGPVRRVVARVLAEEAASHKEREKRDEPDTLRLDGARFVLGVGRSTFWKYLREQPGFPQGKRLGPRLRVWSRQELEAWMRSQPAGKGG